jgi:hypothetical protein
LATRRPTWTVAGVALVVAVPLVTAAATWAALPATTGGRVLRLPMGEGVVSAASEAGPTADPLLQPGHYSAPGDDATVGPPMLQHAAPGGPDDGAMPGWLPAGLEPWWLDIVAAAHEHGLDSHAFGAIVAQENPWGNPAAVSPAGASGLAQLMPATAADIAGKSGIDVTTPTGNLRGGAWYYAARVRDAGDLWQSPADDEGVLLVAAAAYNGGGPPAADVRAAVRAGAGDVCAGVRYRETRTYCYAFRDRWRQTLAERGTPADDVAAAPMSRDWVRPLAAGGPMWLEVVR